MLGANGHGYDDHDPRRSQEHTSGRQRSTSRVKAVGSRPRRRSGSATMSMAAMRPTRTVKARTAVTPAPGGTTTIPAEPLIHAGCPCGAIEAKSDTRAGAAQFPRRLRTGVGAQHDVRIEDRQQPVQVSAPGSVPERLDDPTPGSRINPTLLLASSARPGLPDPGPPDAWVPHATVSDAPVSDAPVCARSWWRRRRRARLARPAPSPGLLGATGAWAGWHGWILAAALPFVVFAAVGMDINEIRGQRGGSLPFGPAMACGLLAVVVLSG